MVGSDRVDFPRVSGRVFHNPSFQVSGFLLRVFSLILPKVVEIVIVAFLFLQSILKSHQFFKLGYPRVCSRVSGRVLPGVKNSCRVLGFAGTRSAPNLNFHLDFER